MTLSHRDKQIWIILLCVFFGYLLFHTQYSFCMSDEVFYISQVKQLFFGGRLIIDEWHPTQFYSPILLPFYSAFRFFSGSDEGVIRFFRVIEVILSFISSLAFFTAIKKKASGLMAFCSAALLMLFSRANIAGVSYYNLNLHFSVLFFVSMSSALKSTGRKAAVFSVLSGIFMALAVLCQPFTAILYIGLIVHLLINKATRRNCLIVSGTVLLMGITYCALFFFKETPAAYLANIRYILTDPEHEGVVASFKRILFSHASVISIPFALLLLIAGIWFYMIRRQRKPLAACHMIFQIGLVLLMVVFAFIGISERASYSVFGHISFASFPSFVYCAGKKEKRLPVQLYIFGLCLAILWGFGSNTGFDGMLVGYVVSGIGSLLLITDILREDMQQNTIKNALYPVFSCLCILVLLVSLAQRSFGFYRDASIGQLDTRISQGPAKGLLTRAETAQQYNELYQIINDEYAKVPDASVVHLKIAPWAYLCCDWKIYAPTTWRNQLSSTRLTEYYSLHDGELPDIVFVYSPKVGSYKSNYFNNHKGLNSFNRMELAGELYDILCGDGYKAVNYQYVTEYIKVKETGE